MLIVGTIRKIQLSVHRDSCSIRHTATKLGISRNTVRKAMRSQHDDFPALDQYCEKRQSTRLIVVNNLGLIVSIQAFSSKCA